MAQAKPEEQTTSPLHLTGMPRDYSRTSFETDEKKRKKKRCLSPPKSWKSSKWTRRKFVSSKKQFGNYKVDRQNKIPRSVRKPEPVNMYFIKALPYKIYCLGKKSQDIVAKFWERLQNGPSL